MAYSYVRYTGSGSTSIYTFSFPFISGDHIKVRVNGNLVYNWSFLSSSTIQFVSPPANGAIIEIRRETPKNSAIVNFTDGSVLLERDLDLLATFDLYLAQETADNVADSISQTSLGVWDAQSKRITNVANPVNAQDAATKAYVDPILTSASVYATQAANSAAAALVSETNAAASYDAFDDRYLGSKASDPTVDNDGNALLVGALYWNTASSKMRGYTGTGWVNIAPEQAVGTLELTATAGQTTFTITGGYNASSVYVYLNGILLDAADYTATNGTSVVLASGAAVGDVLRVITFFSPVDTISIKNAAAASATAAASSATSASTSATSASTSATNAATSATQAWNSSANASGSASDALASKNAAATSATNAATSASAAATSETNAATSASSASTSATTATGAATTATTKASEASTSASSASASATTATTKAGEASASATAAASSATAAATSATNAANSATAAGTSATNAANSATAAANSAASAAVSDFNGFQSGGTANGVAYLNGSKVLITSTALTFDGTTLSVNGGANGTRFSVKGTGAFGGFDTGAATDGRVEYAYNGTNIFYTGMDSASLMSLMGRTGVSLAFGANGSEGMRLTSTGLGIGRTSPAAKLDVNGTLLMPNNTAFRFYDSTATARNALFLDGSNNFQIQNNVNNGNIVQTVYGTGAYTWLNSSTTLMTLNSSGNLGIGTSSPGAKLHVSTTGDTQTKTTSGATNLAWATYTNGTNTVTIGQENSLGGNLASGTSAYAAVVGTNSSYPLQLVTGNLVRATFDSAGNLGLGVTPAAWASGWKAIQFGHCSVSTGSATGVTGRFYANAYFDGTNDVYLNSSSNYATKYVLGASGQHQWFTAPVGTAGNTVSFTQAMTLDASGNLGIGTTSPSANLEVKNSTGAANFKVSDGGTVANTVWIGNRPFGATVAGIYTDGASSFAIGTNSTERMRLDSSGNLLVGRTAQVSGEKVAFEGASTGWLVRVRNTQATTSAQGLEVNYTAQTPNGTGSPFYYGVDATALRYEVRSNGGIANYQANNVNLSDRREKTNFEPAGEYLSKICAIPVQTFNYIDQSEDDPGKTLGVVAQDVQAVAPELVMESDWGTEDNPKVRLSIYQTDLQYALMKCIQEQQVLIEQLTARVASLEGK